MPKLYMDGDYNAKFNPKIVEYTEETRGHADDFNEVHRVLINNDAILYRMVQNADDKARSAATYLGTEITIAHSLDSYPIARVVMDMGYGDFGYGTGQNGGCKRQVPTIMEYIDTDNSLLILNETIDGEYTIKTVDVMEGLFIVNFDSGKTLDVKLIK